MNRSGGAAAGSVTGAAGTAGAEAGDGPAVFVILITGFIVVGAALFVEMAYAPPYWLHALIWGPLAILLPLLLLRSFKGVLIALQYKHKAEEGRLASE